MTQWSLEETRELVQARYGRPQLELVRPSLQSLGERQGYAGYHFHEARGLVDSWVSTRLTEVSLLQIVVGDDEEAVSEFNTLMLKTGAHVLACVQSMHATADILAHVVYFSLGMNRAGLPIPEVKISLRSVIDRTKSDPRTKSICCLLRDLSSGGGFHHLAALSNLGKHRSIVRPALNEDWTGKAPERHTLKFPPFTYKNKHYPEVAVKEFLEAEYSRNSHLVVATGNAVNDYLRQNAP
jgi:hypothetical protein